MHVLSRRRRRHRVPAAAQSRARRSVVVDLPGAPGAAHGPAPLVLPLVGDLHPWALPWGERAARELAAFLAVLDVAPPGPLLDIGTQGGEHALLAAVYGARTVRALEADAVRAHAARQAAATNALAVVVDELRLAEAPGAGETLDAYAARVALDPAVVRVGPGTDVAGVLAGGLGLLRRRRPWVVLPSQDRRTATDTREDVLARLPELAAAGYAQGTARDAPGHAVVLAPEPVPAIFGRRLDAWTATLLDPVVVLPGAADVRGLPLHG